MSLIKCPKCGEMFSDSYKTCPFCEEDEAFANGGKKPVNPGRRVHRQKSPSILGPTLVLVLVLQWLTSPLSSHMLSMFEYRADENLGQHLDLSDAEYHTEDEEVAAK